MYYSKNPALTAEGGALDIFSRPAGWTTQRFSAEEMQRDTDNLNPLAAGPAWPWPAIRARLRLGVALIMGFELALMAAGYAAYLIL